MINFIANKYFTNNFMFMRRTRELHTTVVQIELHNFFVQQNREDEIFFGEQKRVLLFCFNYLVDGAGKIFLKLYV
jgi:hypothetical protein